MFNTENTLLTMITTKVYEDKSLQNSVNLYSYIHYRNKERIQEELNKLKAKQADTATKRHRGRPRK